MATLPKSWQTKIDQLAAHARPLADLAAELPGDTLLLNCGDARFAVVTEDEHRAMVSASDAYPALTSYCHRTSPLRSQVSYWWRSLYGTRPYPQL